MAHQLKVLQSVLSTLLEGGRGVSGTAFPNQPALALKLYDMEGCPFCRRVREVLTLLNLDVQIYPCPKNGKRFRTEAIVASGESQFPLLIDENTGKVLLESQAIIDYLFATYGKNGKTPKKWQNLSESAFGGILISAASGMRGLTAHTGNSSRAAPEQLLELWSFEASPYSRPVRERLCELELPYVLHNVAKERWQDMGPAVLRAKPGPYQPLVGGKREKMLPIMQGKMQVPYLVDPNTGVKMFESKAILQYLNRTYA
jgi:glutathione S-transferase